MLNTKEKRERIDYLIDHLWSRGYLTLSRKFGKYLPAPSPLGNYEVDAIAKYKQKLAIGLVLTEDELDNPYLITKLHFLVHNNPKNSFGKVTIFIAVTNRYLIKTYMILAGLNENTKSHIKIVPIEDD
jgi:hypothetical protein